jgi:hypothetical protein
MSDSTTKEILHTLHRAARELTSYRNKRLMWEYVTARVAPSKNANRGATMQKIDPTGSDHSR